MGVILGQVLVCGKKCCIFAVPNGGTLDMTGNGSGIGEQLPVEGVVKYSDNIFADAEKILTFASPNGKAGWGKVSKSRLRLRACVFNREFFLKKDFLGNRKKRVIFAPHRDIRKAGRKIVGRKPLLVQKKVLSLPPAKLPQGQQGVETQTGIPVAGVPTGTAKFFEVL